MLYTSPSDVARTIICSGLALSSDGRNDMIGKLTQPEVRGGLSLAAGLVERRHGG